MVESNWLVQEENGVSAKDPSKTIRSFLPSLKIKPCGVRHKFVKNLSSHHVNTSTCLSRSYLLMVVSTLAMFLDVGVWLPRAWSCLGCSALMWPMRFVGL